MNIPDHLNDGRKGKEVAEHVQCVLDDDVVFHTAQCLKLCYM